MIALSSRDALFSAMRSARQIDVGAYMLGSGDVLDAIEGALERGARVTVRIEGTPLGSPGGVGQANARTVARLRSEGADAKLVDTGADSAAPMHMKAVVCDGSAFLDDRNWPRSGANTVIRDTTVRDVAAVRHAIKAETSKPSPRFWTDKASALHGETDLLRGAAAKGGVEVESESFGRGSGVYGALDALARQGVACRLLVSKQAMTTKEADALRQLARDGVEVRVGICAEKIALAGSGAWLGCANATTAYFDGNTIEWALRTKSRNIVAALKQKYKTNWNAAKPFDPTEPTRPSTSSA